MTGRTIGRYEIVQQIGQGGQSTAYKARDPKINRTVAIKRMRPQSGVDEALQPEFVARFVREAQAAGRLSHPNIAVIYDVGDDMGEPYIAMEYIDGAHFAAILERDFPLPLTRIAHLFGQLCDGLDYAHKNGIIHRDIKPANVMLTKEDQVKIVDFGIAKLSSSNLTQTGYILGTPSYMSPELIMGRAIDHRSDIFSVGVMLYETLAGQLPFVGHNPTTVIYKIVNETLPSLYMHRPDLPAKIEMVVNKALAKNPEQRYQNCLDLSADLKQIVNAIKVSVVSAISPGPASVAEGRAPDMNATIVPSAKTAPTLATPPRQRVKPETAAALAGAAPSAAAGEAYSLKGRASLQDRISALAAKVPPRWLIPGSAAIGVLFLFFIWLLVRVTGSGDAPLGRSEETNSVTLTVPAMIEDSSASPPPSTLSPIGSGPAASEKTTDPAVFVSTIRARKAVAEGKSPSPGIVPTTTRLFVATPTTLLIPVILPPPPRPRNQPSAESSTARTTGGASSRFRIPIEHNHFAGACQGTLLLTDSVIEFIPEEGDHRFSSAFSQLRKFELKGDRIKSRLSVKAKDGRDYNFDAKGADAVQKLTGAYQRIAAGRSSR